MEATHHPPHDPPLGDSSNSGGGSPSGSLYRRAAEALVSADYLLVLAGAGMSADSGLGTYETMPDTYRDLCDPARLAEGSTRKRFLEFWHSFALQYAATQPHEGYAILDEWCHGGKLARLSKGSVPKNDKNNHSKWWVYTSNVDGHFRRYPSFSGGGSSNNNNRRVCEIHGCALEFKCSCRMGYFDRERFPRVGDLWERWNASVERIRWNRECQDRTETLDELFKRQKDEQPPAEAASSGSTTAWTLPGCSECNGALPMRPNVLMFNDTDETVLGPIRDSRRAYQDWEARVESSVASLAANLVLLEVGCGTAVPAVRQESEEVVRDTLAVGLCLPPPSCGAAPIDGGDGGSVTLIRINPKDAGVDDPGLAPHVVSIYDTSRNALLAIDQAIDALLNPVHSTE